MEQVGEYIVRRLVGEGGMGKVYEAEERLSKRRVALKVLREELAQSEKARGMFLNEMQILAHLEHPNIVRSLASVEADGKLVTVLEFLDGRTLREVLIERGRLGWDDAAFIICCVARALVAAHGQEPPVIHRDLKPENIMVLDDGTVKVMDFGIAKLVQELNQTNTQSVGTLQYMSPEQIDAQTIDQRTDLYCLGLMFYELLSGHPPFQSSSPRTLLNLQCTESPPALAEDVRSGLPKGIEKSLFQLLEKAPDDRPRSAGDVVDLLEMFLPEKSFRALGERGSGAVLKASVSTPAKSDGTPTGRNDTLPSASEAPSTPSGKTNKKKKQQGGKALTERKDTVALIDAASSERELSTGLSIVIIVLLMVVAGVGTYMWRAGQGAEGAADRDTAEPASDGAASDEAASDEAASDETSEE
jgi:serine/threonine protein kinase